MRKKPGISAQELYQFYIRESRPGREVAEILGITISKVYRYLRVYRIPRRPRGGGSIKVSVKMRAEKQLEKPDRKCMAVRADGKQCSNWNVPGFRYCWTHLDGFDRQKASLISHLKQDRIRLNFIIYNWQKPASGQTCQRQ